jgi:hypothetical protein
MLNDLTFVLLVNFHKKINRIFTYSYGLCFSVILSHKNIDKDQCKVVFIVLLLESAGNKEGEEERGGGFAIPPPP